MFSWSLFGSLGAAFSRFYASIVLFAAFNALTFRPRFLLTTDTYSMTISQYARQFEEYHEAVGPANRREITDRIPLPPNHRFSPKNPSSADYDQDRVPLSATEAIRYKRIFPLVDSVKVEPSAAGANTPASAQIVAKISWWNSSAQHWDTGFSARRRIPLPSRLRVPMVLPHISLWAWPSWAVWKRRARVKCRRN